MTHTGISRLNFVLPCLTVLMLAATLFAPSERLLGIDFGATCASLYAVSLALLVWRVAYARDAMFPADFSIAERRGWSALFFGILILLTFAHFLWALSDQSEVPGTFNSPLLRRVAWNPATLIVAAVVMHGVLGRRSGSDVDLDERDLRIKHMADRAGNAMLTFVVIACVVLLAALPSAVLEWWLAPIIAAHVLIGVLICKSLAENAWLVASYVRARR